MSLTPVTHNHHRRFLPSTFQKHFLSPSAGGHRLPSLPNTHFTSSQATEYLSTDTSLRYRHRPSLWPAKPTSTARPVANPVPPSPGPKTPSTPCFRPTGSNSDKPAPNLDEYSEYNTQAAKPRLEAALRRKPLGFFFQWNPQRQSQYQRHKKCCVLRARRYQRRFSSPLTVPAYAK
ncbi:hypothetical protein CGMCC3_g13704 [Colletotrichum fructicola]|nr:uncharacterized protein CGMCC3_g13704 [Colletotrichum fructicola]KAE9570100.1 hypothetical protein CGMCC3_g13704 [Colletotrichum fructicola]